VCAVRSHVVASCRPLAWGTIRKRPPARAAISLQADGWCTHGCKRVVQHDVKPRRDVVNAINRTSIASINDPSPEAADCRPADGAC
jgi:hypothetical protein